MSDGGIRDTHVPSPVRARRASMARQKSATKSMTSPHLRRRRSSSLATIHRGLSAAVAIIFALGYRRAPRVFWPFSRGTRRIGVTFSWRPAKSPGREPPRRGARAATRGLPHLLGGRPGFVGPWVMIRDSWVFEHELFPDRAPRTGRCRDRDPRPDQAASLWAPGPVRPSSALAQPHTDGAWRDWPGNRFRCLLRHRNCRQARRGAGVLVNQKKKIGGRDWSRKTFLPWTAYLTQRRKASEADRIEPMFSRRRNVVKATGLRWRLVDISARLGEKKGRTLATHLF